MSTNTIPERPSLPPGCSLETSPDGLPVVIIPGEDEEPCLNEEIAVLTAWELWKQSNSEWAEYLEAVEAKAARKRRRRKGELEALQETLRQEYPEVAVALGLLGDGSSD